MDDLGLKRPTSFFRRLVLAHEDRQYCQHRRRRDARGWPASSAGMTNGVAPCRKDEGGAKADARYELGQSRVVARGRADDLRFEATPIRLVSVIMLQI